MEFRIPKQGEIYRHFKGNLYEIIIIARDSETLEEKVVYKEVNGNAAYLRSLPMFVSYVDKEKYPNVTQEFRFELVTEQKEEMITEEAVIDNSLIMGFLNQDSITEKIKYLENAKDNISEKFLEIVAQSLDFVENSGSLLERYNAILRYLHTVDRYERGRLR